MVHKITARRAFWPAVVALVGCLAAGAQAAPLDVSSNSALAAAQLLGDKYGVNIVFKGDFGPPRPVSFSVSDADNQGGRLEAVNALANAVGADFSKTYVLSKLGADEDVPPVRVDSDAPVAFRSMTVAARDAILAVAGADNAAVQIPADVSGDVTLTGTQLTAASAAQQIAAQTHTRWKVFYALTPSAGGHTLAGKVIGRTSGGSPITELPYVSFRRPAPPAPDVQTTGQQPQAGGAQQAANPQTPMQNGQGYSPYNTPPYGYFQNGLDPSGNGYDYGNPYGYFPNGNGYGMGTFGPGNYVFPGISGYGSGFDGGGFGNAYGPIVFGGSGF